MNIGIFLDIAVMLYILYNILIGFKHGLIKSLFISFGFLLKAFITFFVYAMFYQKLIQDRYVNLIISNIRNFVINFMPNLKIVSGLLDIIIFILLVYFIASVILLVIFRLLKSIIDSDILSTTDKMLGSLFSTIKAILIVMFLVYSFDTVSDYAVSISVKDSLSYSMILPKLYYYNIFMNFL